MGAFSVISKYFSLLIFALIISLSLSLLPTTNSISFKIPRFEPNASDIHYQGDAVYSVGKVEFNKVNYITRVGLITYHEKVRLWGKKSGNVSDFSTNFTFVIDTLEQPLGNYGHGFTFFIAPAGFEIPPNSAGGFLGLFNTTTSHSSSNKMIVVEFDSFANPEWDPDYEHVGININSVESAVSARWNTSLHSGHPAHVWINYNATTKNLTVLLSYTNDSNNNVRLSYPIDLKEVIPEWVNIGFSAATGQFAERHILESWEFYSSMNLTEEDKALGKDGSDNDLQIKLKLNKLGLILVSLGVFVFILGGIILVLYFLCVKRKKPELENVEDTSFNEELERGAGPKRFSYSELESATHSFSSERKLGEGGFGGVYKGYLVDLDMPIAVKKFSRGGTQGKKEYSTEVKVISRLRHRNLVQLIGWCHDKGEFLLVYEYMPNGSLDGHLFGNKTPLSWPARHRPSIKQAIQLLNFETTMPSLPPQMPVPIYQVPVMMPSDSSSGPSLLTNSIEIGR
ncbi:hypothetical protein SOVF_015620 [Spinacia oleracea]|nr:hypothetical protein SOVF_015620 [Spinacia oleracea]